MISFIIYSTLFENDTLYINNNKNLTLFLLLDVVITLYLEGLLIKYHLKHQIYLFIVYYLLLRKES